MKLSIQTKVFIFLAVFSVASIIIVAPYVMSLINMDVEGYKNSIDTEQSQLVDLQKQSQAQIGATIEKINANEQAEILQLFVASFDGLELFRYEQNNKGYEFVVNSKKSNIDILAFAYALNQLIYSRFIKAKITDIAFIGNNAGAGVHVLVYGEEK